MIFSPKIKPFRFWSQKVLPLVYDDSLSYYEVLDKVAHKLNELIEYFNEAVYQNVEELVSQYFVTITYDSSDEEIDLSIGE